MDLQVYEVEIPDSVVPTELQCDIQPGALRQRYSVQWRQILNYNMKTLTSLYRCGNVQSDSKC